ncbi:GNAT family N-acetyltransferase [Microlunatus parietis]|uniref:Putative N-acetyltransferase YhbS n=1 Tax=Microlunatus parietis TaxID=682979 RepID=A0A7Y9LED0_9ACTN|nr:GNAT family N-acetyltransferase [Microlunatus parietis]NYE74822.1 putative N-acetyltransferase YhbS [Microlunatus parietis]
MNGPLQEQWASGPEALTLATDLLRRARLADPYGGVWEAADVQWWSRRPRASDDVPRPFWLDDDGPVAGVLITSWRDDRWQCDPIMVPGSAGPEPAVIWAHAVDLVQTYARGTVELTVREDDESFSELIMDSGFTVQGRSMIDWLAPEDRASPPAPAPGFKIIDRTTQPDAPHPMRGRNGPEVAERLLACPLYDPELDLAVQTEDGRLAGYSLYWFDPVTRVGLVEPMRVEDEFQRRGLATAMLLEGVDRLARRGAERIKVFGPESGPTLYRTAGFRPAHALISYQVAASNAGFVGA